MSGASQWLASKRRALGYSVDGMHLGDGSGQTVEVVDPRWWQLGRWWVWLFRTRGHVTFTVQVRGQSRAINVRVRRVPSPPPTPVHVGGGVVGRPVDPKVLARRGHDPDHRLVPDEVLERYNVTRREPGGVR